VSGPATYSAPRGLPAQTAGHLPSQSKWASNYSASSTAAHGCGPGLLSASRYGAPRGGALARADASGSLCSLACLLSGVVHGLCSRPSRCTPLGASAELQVRVVGDGHHAMWEKLPYHLLQPMATVVHTPLQPKNYRAIGGEIRDDALVAKVGERDQV
jgi:hypothetical protein